MERSERRILAAGLAGLVLLILLAIVFHADRDGDKAKTAGGGIVAPAGGVSVTVSGKTANVRGTVANDTLKSSVLAAAKVTTPDGDVTDDLQVAAGGLAVPWLAAVVQALPQPKERFKNIRLDVTAKSVTISGIAPSKATKQALEGRIAVALGSAPRVHATNSLTVAVSPDTTASQAQIDAAIHGGTVSFQVGSSVITPAGKRVLDRVVPPLKRYPKVLVQIAGHTDSTGAAADNVKLSLQRAVAVKLYLVSKGIVATRLTTHGFGASKPIANNNTPSGRAHNRRITFTAQ